MIQEKHFIKRNMKTVLEINKDVQNQIKEIAEYEKSKIEKKQAKKPGEIPKYLQKRQQEAIQDKIQT